MIVLSKIGWDLRINRAGAGATAHDDGFRLDVEETADAGARWTISYGGPVLAQGIATSIVDGCRRCVGGLRVLRKKKWCRDMLTENEEMFRKLDERMNKPAGTGDGAR